MSLFASLAYYVVLIAFWKLGWFWFQVTEDPIFARDGADIYVDSNISFTQVRHDSSIFFKVIANG